MGERLKAGLRALAEEHEAIGDVRGLGLMVGIELVQDRETKEPAKDLRNRVVQEAYERGVLLLGAGRSVIRFMPPLNVTAQEIDLGLEVLAEALRAAKAGF
jgi:4-aminobutyrate aminotransferase